VPEASAKQTASFFQDLLRILEVLVTKQLAQESKVRGSVLSPELLEAEAAVEYWNLKIKRERKRRGI